MRNPFPTDWFAVGVAILKWVFTLITIVGCVFGLLTLAMHTWERDVSPMAAIAPLEILGFEEVTITSTSRFTPALYNDCPAGTDVSFDIRATLSGMEVELLACCEKGGGILRDGEYIPGVCSTTRTDEG